MKTIEKSGGNKAGDVLKWLIVAVVVVGAVYANIRYAAVSPSLRIGIGIVLLIPVLFIAFQTSQGKKAWKFLRVMRDEIRRVVWPTRQATLQVTLVVAVMVAVAAVAIFILDQMFLWLIAWLTGQRG